MTSTMNLKVRHNGQIKTIALYSGLASAELSCILQAVFLLNSAAVVVGFLSPEVESITFGQQNVNGILEFTIIIYMAANSMNVA